MKPGPMEPYFPVFMLSWIALGIGSWIWISTRPSADEKRLWHRRVAIGAAIVFGVFITLLLVQWHQPSALLVFIPALVLIAWLNLRFTDFCDNCNRRVYKQFWWGRIDFCPHCGARLPRPM